MAEHLNKDEFLAHMGPIREDIKELVSLQREQNGRVGRAESRIAVLEDRTPSRAETNGVSAVISAVISGLSMWFQSQK